MNALKLLANANNFKVAMHICIPLKQKPQMMVSSDELMLAPHFGAAACFVVIDSETGELLRESTWENKCSGPCHCPLPALCTDQLKVDALAGQAVGFRLMQLFRRSEIPVYETNAHTLGEFRAQMAQLFHHRLRQAKCFTRSLCKEV